MTGGAAFVVLSNAAPGRADELRTWYDKVHLPDACAIPGVAAARLYEMAPIEGMPPATHTFMAVYELDGDPASVWAEFERRIAEGVMAMNDALDSSSASFTVWTATAEAEPA